MGSYIDNAKKLLPYYLKSPPFSGLLLAKRQYRVNATFMCMRK